MSGSDKKRSRKSKLIPRSENDDDIKLQDDRQEKRAELNKRMSPDRNQPSTSTYRPMQFDVKIEVEECDDEEFSGTITNFIPDDQIKTEITNENDLFEAEELKTEIINENDLFEAEELDINMLLSRALKMKKDKTTGNKDINNVLSIINDHKYTNEDEAPKTSRIQKPTSIYHLHLEEDYILEAIDELSKEDLSPADKILAVESKNLWGRLRMVDDTPSKQEARIQIALNSWKYWKVTCKSGYLPKMYKCYICEKAWWHLGPFQDHMNMHDDKELRVETESQGLEYNIIAYNPKAPHAFKSFETDTHCWKCGYTYNEHPTEETKNYPCTHCGLSFGTCIKLKRHECDCLPKLKILVKNGPIVVYSCKICDLKVLSKDSLERHYMDYHDVRSDLPTTVDVRTCTTCSKNYMALPFHYCNKKNYSVMCTFCNKRFPSKVALTIHLKEKDDYPCTVCKMVLRKKCQEAEHMLQHTDKFTRLYKCLSCKENVMLFNEDSTRRHKIIWHKQKIDKRRNYFEMVLAPRKFIEAQTVEEMDASCGIKRNLVKMNDSDFQMSMKEDDPVTERLRNTVSSREELEDNIKQYLNESDLDCDENYNNLDDLSDSHSIQDHDIATENGSNEQMDLELEITPNAEQQNVSNIQEQLVKAEPLVLNENALLVKAESLILNEYEDLVNTESSIASEYDHLVMSEQVLVSKEKEHSVKAEVLISNEYDHLVNTEQPQTSSSDDSDSSDSVPLSLFERGRQKTLSGQRRSNQGYNSPTKDWSSRTFYPKRIKFTEPAYMPLNSENFDEIHYFLRYINDDLIALIVEMSNTTHELETGLKLNLTASELYTFIGTVMAMSCIGYPTIKMYWEKKFRIPLIAGAMSRDRFSLLRNKIKFVIDYKISDAEKTADKLWKVRPLIAAIQDACKALPKDRNLCVDEMIVPFTGNCGIKQYCYHKPNPTGLKVFVLTDPKGLVLNFDFYQGATTYPKYDNTNLELREKAVLHLTEDITPGHVIYFDRYFTSTELMEELSKRNLMATGPIQKNRLPADVKLILKEKRREILQEGRGTCRVITNSANKLAVTMWLDNKHVTFLSNIYAEEPTDSSRRWSKKSNSYTYISRPKVVNAFDSNRGGVQAEKYLSVCPSRHQTRKWTFRVFCHMLDLAVCNSWVSYKEDQKASGVNPKNLCSFKMTISESLIDQYCETSSHSESDPNEDKFERQYYDPVPRVKRGRRFAVPTPTYEFRHRKAKHMPEFATKVNRCKVCSKKSWLTCKTCLVHLCLVRERNCFMKFHCP
ncbi:uncharacterized protein LOC114353207 isoform X1 [Ostrinia furnacalis]|uniref:uncharacterized protein LOC114353207 isoform X1 n=2 Tax=Ostrinia furnacalis TaxID=93504 RepID=UPI00103FD32A|nr:uncharacterized protein LOC114353207 isoform X1 [Ostrinia furnacalis]